MTTESLISLLALLRINRMPDISFKRLCQWPWYTDSRIIRNMGFL